MSKKVFPTLCLALALAACGGGGSSSDSTAPTPIPPVSTAPAPVNAAPVANAGALQSISVGSVVTLDGAASDANGDALNYKWTLSTPLGSAAKLSSITTAKPTFTADVSGTYIATLIANDGKVDSSPSTVNITASIAKSAPVANAGPNQNVITSTLVVLDGSASSDANGDLITYVWTLTSKPTGSNAILTSLTSSKPTFNADIAGTYTASLVVNDGRINSNSSTVSVIAAVGNAAPVANANVAQNVVAGASVTLDGTASSDANGDVLNYSWSMTSKPDGSTASLNSTTIAKPTFVADKAGTYVASLVVNDGKIGSNTATVTVTAAVANVAPVANAGPAQNVSTGSVVKLSGDASSDANGDKLTYQWTMTSKPIFSSAALSSTIALNPIFTADQEGAYVVSLIVNDGMASSTAKTVTVTAVLKADPVPSGTGLIAQNSFNFSVFNESTMTSSLSSSCGRAFNAIDVRPDGVVIAVDTSSLYEIDVFKPACINKGRTPEWINTFAVESTGQYWGISFAQDSTKISQRLHRLAADGSSTSFVYLSGATTYITGMDFDPSGSLIGVAIVSGGWGLVKVDTATGVTTLVAMLPQHPDHDIDIDQSGLIRGIKGSELLYISASTGIVTKRVNVPNFGPATNFYPILFVK